MSKARGSQLLWIILVAIVPAIVTAAPARAQPVAAASPPERILVRNESGEEHWMILEDADRLVYAVESDAEASDIASSLTSPWALGLFAFGLVGQLLFFGRFFVQWLVSEREGRSVVPLSFWWLSLSGGFVLLIYFILRLEPIGVIGQASGFIIYMRNIALIRREQGRVIQ